MGHLWQGEAARTLKFRPEGFIHWNGSFNDMEWRFVDPQKDEDQGHAGAQDNSETQSGTAIKTCHRLMGSFPSEVVLRHSSWGFILNSPWVVYTSFPMFREDIDREVSDSGLRSSVASWQWAEAEDYNQLQAGSDDEED